MTTQPVVVMAATVKADATGVELHQPLARRGIAAIDATAHINGLQSLPPTKSLDPVVGGRGTPIPADDALPSVKATSAVRQALRRSARSRIFPSVEYKSRVSYFDPRSDYGNFRGFFVLFWIGLAIMVVTAMLRNLKDTGAPLNIRQWPLFTRNVYELAAVDFAMCASLCLTLPLHLVFRNSWGLLQWNRGGILVQSIFQLGWLAVWIAWPFWRNWSWTAQVFLTLHTLALFMKLHSYAFYNGHLAIILRRLEALDKQVGATVARTKLVRYPSTRGPADTPETAPVVPGDGGNSSSTFELRKALAKEITSPLGNVTYPHNLTFANLVDYLLCPTLCYELEYPRTPVRNYTELSYKVLAVFGCIFLMTVTSEEFIIPVLEASQIRLVSSSTWLESALIFAETVSSLLFPFMVTFLLVFLVIFEYVLGAFAEITRFADRQFYSDWWNSQDWMQFSSSWNMPVHNFFHRHVYSASRGAGFSRAGATATVFFISAIAHELIMGCITRKFRGYGFFMMMLQIPLVAIQRLPWVQKQTLLNNVLFWIFMIMGLSMLCALYVLI